MPVLEVELGIVDEDGLLDIVPVLVPPCCWTGLPSLRLLLFPETGGVVVGAFVVADGALPVAVAAAGRVVVPVLVEPVADCPCIDWVGAPSLRLLSLAVTGAVVVGAVVVAEGVAGVVCAEATPSAPTRAAAAAAVLRSLK